jgi:hypothetical protein
MMFSVGEFVKINSDILKEYIDRGAGRIVEIIPDGPYLSVDFQCPEPENLWLLPSEIVPVEIAVRNRPSYSSNIVECFGRPYEVPSNEGDPDEILDDDDPDDKPSIIWQESGDLPERVIEWQEF